MRSCLQTANHIDYTHEGRKALNYADAFYMATLGGAKGKLRSYIQFLGYLVFFF